MNEGAHENADNTETAGRRRNTSMKIVIDTFERYYQNGTEACNSQKFTCAFSLFIKVYYNF